MQGIFMFNLAKIFGKSPFPPLQSHMKKVKDCVHLLQKLFHAVKQKDEKQKEEIAKKISKLEHEADLTKNDIRNHLPRSLFLPIDKSALLEILSLQDSLADLAEDIAGLVTLKSLDPIEGFQEKFEQFCDFNINVFDLADAIITEFDALLESSFGGIEAEKVKEMIENLAYEEHQLDLLQHELMKILFSYEKFSSFSSFFLWQNLLKSVGNLANFSEKLANRIRTILEVE